MTFEDFEDIAKEHGGLLIIFDDIDAIPNNKENGYLKRKVYELMNSIINNSRKHNINVIFTSHYCLDAKNTGTMISSCSNWVFFSQNMTAQIEQCANKYFGFNKKQINALKELAKKGNTHWISVNRTTPMTITTENDIFKLEDIELIVKHID